jgi:hypothetical protein
MHMTQSIVRKFALRLYHDRAGLALIEFALSAPIMLLVGCYGVELANLAMVHMRADNASRVGAYSNLATQQLREVDVNDILQGARYQGKGIDLTVNGRITLSSLENVAQSYDTQPVQRIHWQRCIGVRGGVGFDGQFKTNVPTTAGSTDSMNDKGYDLPLGISDNGSAPIMAPGGAGVMYVEVNYRTKPLFGTWFVPTQAIHYIASFVVRDRRDYSQIYNPVPKSAPSTCDLYTP